jgi:hypothetical protein
MGQIRVTNLTPSAKSLGVVEENVSGVGERWYDAWGDVAKDILTNWEPGEWTVTAVGTSPITGAVTGGAVGLITSGASDFDGDNIQRLGTKYKLEAGKPLRFMWDLTINEATQSDLIVGLFGTDTTLSAASSAHALAVSAGGVGFTKLDNTVALNFKAFSTATETHTAVVTAAFDVSNHIYEIYWDGTTLFGYYDGVLIASFASVTSEVLTPSLAFRTGSAAAKTCIFGKMYCVQARS